MDPARYALAVFLCSSRQKTMLTSYVIAPVAPPTVGLAGVLWVKVKHIHIRGKILKRPLVRVSLGQRARRYTFSPCALQGQTTVWNKAFTLPVDGTALDQTVRPVGFVFILNPHTTIPRTVGRANKQFDQVAAADAGK